MSDEALGIDDGTDAVVDTTAGNIAVPALNVPSSGFPSLERIFDPTNLSPFMTVPTLNLSQ